MSEELKRPTANDGWSGDVMCYGAEEADAYMDLLETANRNLVELVREAVELICKLPVPEPFIARVAPWLTKAKMLKEASND